MHQLLNDVGAHIAKGHAPDDGDRIDGLVADGLPLAARGVDPR